MALDKALKCVENQCQKSGPECSVEEVSCNGWRWVPAKFCGKSRSERAFGPTWIRRKVCVCLRTASMEWNVPGKYGPQGELFYFLIQKEPATVLGQ